MDILLFVLLAAAGYLLGSVNSSIVVGKLIYKTDVREYGSGNAGTTNTMRTLGKSAGILVIAGDILKGVTAFLLGKLIIGDNGAIMAGFFSIIGHNWPVYFKFRGGKGALTSFAVVAMMDIKIALLLLGIFVLLLLITRRVSVGSLIAAAAFPVVSIIFGKSIVFIVFSVLIACLIIYRHRSNIKRIMNGQEPKSTIKKRD